MLLTLGALLTVGNANAGRYILSRDASVVRFHMVATLHEINGEVNDYTGELDIGPGSTHSGQIQIPTLAITTGLAIRDTRMFEYVLRATQYPTITYVLKGMAGDTATLDSGAGSGRLTLSGTITVSGVTQDLDIPAAFTWEGDQLKLVGKVTTQWTDFKLPDPSIAISTLQPPIDIKFAVKAVKAP